MSATNTSTSGETSINSIPNWSKRVGNETEPSNREIKAYELGIEDRKLQEKDEVKTLFLANLELCCYYSSKFHDFLTKEKKVDCLVATIKSETINKFHSLFVINFSDYKNKDLRSSLYKEINNFRKALNTKYVCFEVSLLGSETKEFDKTPLYEDGFVLEYNGNEQGEKAN